MPAVVIDLLFDGSGNLSQSFDSQTTHRVFVNVALPFGAGRS
jgi:hypothetical protein